MATAAEPVNKCSATSGLHNDSLSPPADDRAASAGPYDEEIIPHFKLPNVASSRKSRGQFYVRRPRELERVAVWVAQQPHRVTAGHRSSRI